MGRTMVDEDYQKLKEEEAQKKDLIQKQVVSLKNEREEQVIRARVTRELERQEMLEAGRRLAQQANRALEVEQEDALVKKEKEKKLMSKLIVQWNEEQKEHAEKQKKEHAAERQAVLKLQEELVKEQEQKH